MCVCARARARVPPLAKGCAKVGSDWVSASPPRTGVGRSVSLRCATCLSLCLSCVSVLPPIGIRLYFLFPFFLLLFLFVPSGNAVWTGWCWC